jgi:DNA-binding CsgD family transcriptional regulator
MDESRPIARTARQRRQFAHKLTGRELDVIKMLLDDMHPKEIATELGVSYQTVKNHLRNVRQVLGIRTTLGLGAYLLREGVIR